MDEINLTEDEVKILKALVQTMRETKEEQETKDELAEETKDEPTEETKDEPTEETKDEPTEETKVFAQKIYDDFMKKMSEQFTRTGAKEVDPIEAYLESDNSMTGRALRAHGLIKEEK